MFTEEELLAALPAVKGTLKRLSKDLWQDDLQEVALKAWEKRDSFRGESSLTTWLTRIAVNCALMRRRKRSEQTEHITQVPSGEAIYEHIASSRLNPEQIAAKRQASAILMQALEHIDPNLAWELILFSAYPGINDPCAKTRRHRGRKAMRQSLAKLGINKFGSC